MFCESEYDTLAAKKPLTKDEAFDILDRIPYIRTIKAPNNKILLEFYAEAMNKRNYIEWISVIKTAYIRNKDKKLLAEEAHYAEEAKKYLYDELSQSLGIPFTEMESYIERYVANSI